MYGSVSEFFLNAALEADMPRGEYENFLRDTTKQNELLVKSAKAFRQSDITSWRVTEIRWFLEYYKLGIRRQSEYTKIPFRNYNYDTVSTVATAGGAILIATVIEYLLKKTQSFSLEDIAMTAAEKGYAGYIECGKENYIPTGCKDVFFDRFIPSLYRISVERAESVREMLEAIFDYKVLVVSVDGKVYRQNPEVSSEKSCYLLVLGYNPKEMILFDPENEGDIKVSFDRVIGGLKAAWIFEKRK